MVKAGMSGRPVELGTSGKKVMADVPLNMKWDILHQFKRALFFTKTRAGVHGALDPITALRESETFKEVGRGSKPYTTDEVLAARAPLLIYCR